MKKEQKNKELQSRREFFKNAVKGALPILGAIMLAGVPQIMNGAKKVPFNCTGDACKFSCTGTCKGNCGGICSRGCSAGCKYTCDRVGK